MKTRRTAGPIVRVVAVLVAAGLGCTESSPSSYHWTAIGATETTGVVWGLSFAPDGTPYATTDKGFFRFDGKKFAPAEPAFPSWNAPIRWGPDGTTYNYDSRLRPGSSSWERIPGASDWLASNTTVVPTSDGALYAITVASKLGVLAPGASTWTLLGREGETFYEVFPVTDGALVTSDRGLYTVRAGELHYLFSTSPAMLVAPDGTQYDATANYTRDFSEIIARKLNGEEELVTDGLTCHQVGAEPCPFNQITPHASFIAWPVLAPSGAFYEMWAAVNSVDAPRTVMRLRPGSRVWEPLKSTQEPDGSGIDGLAQLAVDAHDTIWVFSNAQIARINDDGWVNSMTSAIYRLDPD
jgi:hypothetical protein